MCCPFILCYLFNYECQDKKNLARLKFLLIFGFPFNLHFGSFDCLARDSIHSTCAMLWSGELVYQWKVYWVNGLDLGQDLDVTILFTSLMLYKPQIFWRTEKYLLNLTKYCYICKTFNWCVMLENSLFILIGRIAYNSFNALGLNLAVRLSHAILDSDHW